MSNNSNRTCRQADFSHTPAVDTAPSRYRSKAMSIRLLSNLSANTVRAAVALVALVCFAPAKAVTCADLEGATVFSQEFNQAYLGFFGSQFANDSIMNQFGPYGSPFSSTSVRNEFGDYGSSFGIYSAQNPFSASPPIIYKNQTPIAFLTTNTSLTPRVSLAAIDASCVFFSSTPSASPPAPPLSVSASDGTFSDRIELAWTPVIDATAYNIYVSDSPQSNLVFLGQTTSTFTNITGVTPGVIRYLWVFPVNFYGESPLGRFDSGFAADLSPPSTPANVSASDGTFADRVRVSWSDVARETSYQVFRCGTANSSSCGSEITTTGSNVNSFDDFGASSDGNLSYYRVRACNDNGCSSLSSVDSGFRSLPVPTGPANVDATDGVFDDRVRISWSGVIGAESYQVFRCSTPSTGSCGTAMTTTAENVRSFDDFGASSNGDAHYYRLKACNASGCSAFSSADPGNVSVFDPNSVIFSDGFE